MLYQYLLMTTPAVLGIALVLATKCALKREQKLKMPLE